MVANRQLRPHSTKLGAVLGAQLNILGARMRAEENRRRLEATASALGADLCDPVEYRIAEELARAA